MVSQSLVAHSAFSVSDNLTFSSFGFCQNMVSSCQVLHPFSEYFVNNIQNLADTDHVLAEIIKNHMSILAERELYQLYG